MSARDELHGRVDRLEGRDKTLALGLLAICEAIEAGKAKPKAEPVRVLDTAIVEQLMRVVDALRRSLYAWRPTCAEMRQDPARQANRWIVDLDKLRRIDGASVDHMIRVLDWLTAGRDDRAQFWRANIRSAAKLRQHWDRLASDHEAAGAPTSRLNRRGLQSVRSAQTWLDEQEGKQ